MTTEITMPRLSETMSNGKIVSWNKKVGDRVTKGDTIAEVETDKATMEIEAVDSGTISDILIGEGNTANVGEPIAILNGKGKATPKKAPIEEFESKKEEKPAQKSQEVRVEELPESKTEEIKEEEPIEKETIQEEFRYTPEKKLEKKTEEKPAIREGILKATPGAKKLAQAKGVDLSQLQGTGPGGRITEQDIDNYAESKKPVEKKEAVPEKEQKPEIRTEPLSRMRQTIASRMLESKQNVPHFYVTYEINADKLVEYESKIKEKVPDVTLNDIFIKATALILRDHFMFNSEYKGDHVAIHERINIGIAFAVEKGLLVPVVHDPDKKDLKEISEATKSIKNRVKNNKLTPEDMTDGTFSISNMGMFGVKEFSAIINPPESSGLAVGAIMKIPVVKDNEIVIGNVLNLTLSADHRVVDGAEAAIFLKDLKELLENPEQIESI
ncbi:MAG: hypothetical protein A2287_07825 [Candidatus Melainabacteria bacterium RIFOXYA12_FULL_32_12]|nr:MAG: hypothetical protein A2287_07825 [Candidatus Melainabacteria bacterium RIFOXYA12_FULL_32_12]